MSQGKKLQSRKEMKHTTAVNSKAAATDYHKEAAEIDSAPHAFRGPVSELTRHQHLVPNGVPGKLEDRVSFLDEHTDNQCLRLFDKHYNCRIYSQASLVSKLLRQMAKAWKADSG